MSSAVALNGYTGEVKLMMLLWLQHGSKAKMSCKGADEVTISMVN